jgi:hypothetical protein
LLLRDWKTSAMTHWLAPFTGGEECVVPKGTVLVVAHDLVESASAFYVRPENYKELELRLIPEETRTEDKYNGYSLVLFCKDIGTLAERFPKSSLDPIKIVISRADYEGEKWQRWNAFVDWATKTEAKGLPGKLRGLFMMFWYDSEVQNGGHVQFLSNRGFEFATKTIQALREHGLETHAVVLFHSVNEISKKSPDIRRFIKKAEFINAAMSEEAQKADRDYSECRPPLIEYVEKYLEENKEDVFLIKE